MKKRIRIQGALMFLVVIVSIFFTRFIIPYWRKDPFDEFFDAAGIVMILFGFLSRIAARGYKEEKTNGGKNLVKDGPYYLMRHPMYFGTLLIGSGIILVLLEFWTLPVFLIIYLLIYIPQIEKEEKVLLKRFGEEYRTYCKTTSKYFPQFSLSFKEYVPLKLSWIRKELRSLIIVIAAVLAIEVWKDVRLFGYSEFYKELSELSSVIIVFCAIIFLFIRKLNRLPR